MKNILKITIFIVSLIFVSCSAPFEIFDTRKPLLPLEKRDLQLSHIRFTEVIDNRKIKDSIIGNFEDKPIIVNSDLKDYLLKSYNNIISKNPKDTNLIPVKLTLNELWSKNIYTFWTSKVETLFLIN